MLFISNTENFNLLPTLTLDKCDVVKARLELVGSILCEDTQADCELTIKCY